MEEAETQLGRALTTLTKYEFPFSRGKETRLDAYLQLEDLQRLEETETSVIQLQCHLSFFLDEMRFDLQHKTLSEILHAILRCLSYFMYHRSLAAAFSGDQMAFFLEELLQLLFSTSDRTTYKLCLWCLIIQNFPSDRNKFLPHTVEGLVQAVVNPFKSRAIELQALEGIHLLLVKYPEQLCAKTTALDIYVRPIASRLSSSEASTRTEARLILEEASKYAAKWSKETLKMVHDCAEQYVLLAMKLHIDGGRQKDAVSLWKLTLVLLKSQFSTDLEKLNRILYVPEKCMRDQDAAIRLTTMHAWSGIVDICHDCQNWLFTKAVVRLLAWPIKVCLAQERLLNVLDAAFLSWQKIVNVAVQDFNMYWKAEHQCIESGQQHVVPEWKFWFGNLVISPLLTLMVRCLRNSDSCVIKVELEQLIDVAKRIWEPEVSACDESTSGSCRSRCSSSTIMDRSCVDKHVATQHHENIGRDISTGAQTCARVCITSELLGIAFMFEDVIRAISKLMKVSDESHGRLCKRYTYDLAMATWHGVCRRVLAGLRCKDTLQASKFALRLVRMAMEFSFGILIWTPVLRTMPMTAGVAAPTEHFDKHMEDEVIVAASTEFGLEWQLQLLAPLVSGIAFPEDLQAVMLHPKCKVFDHVTQRMNGLKETHGQCAIVLKAWDAEDSKFRLDFSARSNVLPYLMLDLLFEYAIFADDTKNDCGSGMELTLACLGIAVKRITLSLQLTSRQDSQGLNAVICYAEKCIHAAHELAGIGNMGRSEKSMLDELVNVLLTLDLRKSCETSGVDDFATACTTSVLSDASDAEEKSVGTVVCEAENVSASFHASTSSSCLLSGENCAIQSPVDRSAQPKLQRHSQYSLYQSSEECISTTLDKAGDSEQEDAESFLRMITLPIQSCRSRLTPPKVTTERAHGLSVKMSQCIYPDLVGCTEKIASLYRHFPMGFRPLFSFYKIKTIGDLCVLPVETMRTFRLNDPVSIVRRALEEFDGRKSCMQPLRDSPFPKRSCLATASPAIPTPSSRIPTKRPLPVYDELVSPLLLDRRKHKRVKQSLMLDVDHGEEEHESDGACVNYKLAINGTLCLHFGDTEETRMACRRKDFHDRIESSEQMDENENVQGKMDIYTLKLLQHLRRSVYYMNMLVVDEERMQSEEASLQTKIAAVDGVMTKYQEAHDLVARLASQLKIANKFQTMPQIAGEKRFDVS